MPIIRSRLEVLFLKQSRVQMIDHREILEIDEVAVVAAEVSV